MGSDNKRLLFSVSIKDCRVDTFTVGGHGGSGKDTSNTGVRIVHEPSGASGECREERSQHRNKSIAFARMAKSQKFTAWVRQKASELAIGKTVEEQVEEALRPENLKVEYRTSNGWEQV